MNAPILGTSVPAVSATQEQLVPVFLGQIGGVPAQVCKATDLHSFLQVATKFADWIKDRIEKYEFQQDQDFALISEKSEIKKGRGGDRRSKDYHLSLDMAKELSMVENNPQGRAARRYFIACERAAHQPGSERIGANDHKNLQQVIWRICHHFHEKAAWTQAVWIALRRAVGCPSPNGFEVRHLPLMATELRRILEIVSAMRAHCRALEKDAIRRIVRNREAAGPFIAHLAAEEAAWLNEQNTWHAQVDGWVQKELDAVAQRHPPGGSDHSDYAEKPGGSVGQNE